MDHEWAAQQLKEFRKLIDDFYDLIDYGSNEYGDEEAIRIYDVLMDQYGSSQNLLDRLITLNPVMRTLMNAAQPGLGDYIEAPDEGWEYDGAIGKRLSSRVFCAPQEFTNLMKRLGVECALKAQI